MYTALQNIAISYTMQLLSNMIIKKLNLLLYVPNKFKYLKFNYKPLFML